MLGSLGGCDIEDQNMVSMPAGVQTAQDAQYHAAAKSAGC